MHSSKNPAGGVGLKRLAIEALLILTGAALVYSYCVSVRPEGVFPSSAGDDTCYTELTRQQMGETIEKTGKPGFFMDGFMAPKGILMPFMSWQIERDVIGGWIWTHYPEFPFHWIWFTFSTLLIFFAVGISTRLILMPKGRIPLIALTWAIATLAASFNFPKHAKLWFHSEHTIQHWVWINIFFEAVILHRFYVLKRWSLSLELWRVVALQSVFLITGYFWGPMTLLWLVGRIWLSYEVRRQSKATPPPPFEESTAVTFNRPSAICAVLVMLGLGAFQLSFFLPLARSLTNASPVDHPLGFFSHFGYLFRPLWWEALTKDYLNSILITSVETVTSIGWTYLIPFGLTISLLGRARLRVLMPLLIVLTYGIIYATRILPNIIIRPSQLVLPFMAYFRAASRWGLFFPALTLACTVLGLAYYFAKRPPSARPMRKGLIIAGLGIYLIMLGAELQWLKLPVVRGAPPPSKTLQALSVIRNQPQNTVLDLPFCVIGGNGGTHHFCPSYPESEVHQCFRLYHHKRVYGLYSARMNPTTDLVRYNYSPFKEWFNAYSQQRCFSDAELKLLCEYLDQTQDLAAVIVYPHLWKGSNTPECRARFEHYLGKPVSDIPYSPRSTRFPETAGLHHAFHYAPRCLKR